MTSKAQSFADLEFTRAIYQVSGQTDLPTWNLVGQFSDISWPEYSWIRSHEPELVFQRIKQLVTSFSTWQHRAKTGRPATAHRVVIAHLLVRQYLGASFDFTESLMRVLAPYFGFEQMPDGSTISRWNRNKTFRKTLRRFFAHVLNDFTGKQLTIAVDSTGFGRKRRAWRDTPYGARGTKDWRKMHFAMDTSSGLILGYVTSPSKDHDSKHYIPVLDAIHPQFSVERSLADGAYSGTANLIGADQRNIKPIHTVRKDAIWKKKPTTRYQKLVRFARTFPNRFAELMGPRAYVETTVSMLKNRDGGRIRCRHPIAIENEIAAKSILHNVRMTIRPDTLR